MTDRTAVHPRPPGAPADEASTHGAVRPVPGRFAAGLGAVAARLGARRSVAGPLLLYLFIAACVMAPYRSSKFRSAGDLIGVLGFVVEARNALAEGQFPIRVAPTQLEGARYPVFQYYANFPFTVTGLLCLAGLSPYAAWKIAMLAAFTLGGLFVYLSALRLTRQAPASLLAGAAFVLAPYMFADLNARGAFAELVAFNLLPAAFYATLRCFASRHWRYIPACAVAWALIGLSHNITYLFGVLVLGPLFVSMLGIRRPRRAAGRLLRLAAAGALHATLMIWYVAPQLRSLPLIEIHANSFNPSQAAWLSTIDVLLAPTLRTAPGIDGTSNLGLQVGWVVLAGAALAALGVLIPGRRRRRLRGVTLRLLVLFAVSFFFAWSPVDVWGRLPQTFWFIQFPYRMLVFTTLLGALLVACGLTLCLGRRFRPVVMLPALALVAFAAAPYVPRHGRFDRHFVRAITANPVIGGLNDYLLSGLSTVTNGYPHPDVDLARPEFGLLREGRVRPIGSSALTMPEGAKGLHVSGEVPPPPEGAPPGASDVRLLVKLGDGSMTIPLKPGPFEFSLRLPECFCGEPATFALHPRDVDGREANLTLTSVRYEGAPPAAVRLVTAAEVRPRVAFGRATKLRFESAEPVLLQLPVLYYPGLMRVEDRGEPIPYRNVGRYVAVELSPGRHRLDVRYVGVRWANWIGLLGWSVVGTTVVAAAAAASRRRASVRGGARRPPRPRVSAGQAGAACLAVLAGGAVGLGLPLAQRLLLSRDSGFEPIASREHPENPAAQAFDGIPETAWIAPGADPVTLTLRATGARPIEGIRLHPRVTSLREAWHVVHVIAFEGDEVRLDRTFAFPEAARKDVTDIQFDAPVTADRVELRFSEPVVETINGGRVRRELVSPGYREIELVAPAAK